VAQEDRRRRAQGGREVNIFCKHTQGECVALILRNAANEERDKARAEAEHLRSEITRLVKLNFDTFTAYDQMREKVVTLQALVR
jgi:hypothetical protein